jgi:WD40 repeat protein
MPRQSVSLATFNRGRVSALALARNDIDRVAMSAEVQTNYVPRVLGSMMLRPGLQYIDSTLSDNPAHHLPFVFSTDDQALIELTNESMRVRVGETVISRSAVSTVMRGGDFSADISNFLKVDDPGTTPDADANAVAFSPDGTLMAVAIDVGAGADSILVYSISGTTPTILFQNLTGASATQSGLDVAFSPDGQFLSYTSGGTGNFVETWAITGSGASATFTQLAAPDTEPAGAGRGCAWSPDSTLLAVAHSTTPFVTIYQVSGTGSSATLAKLDNPASLPADTGRGVAWSHDGRFLAVAHDTTPFCTVYDVNGTEFTKLDDASSQFSANLPAGNGQSVAFSRDGNWMAVAHTTTPFVSIYAISDTTFTKTSDPGTLPDGNGRGVAFSSDSQFLAVAHATSLFLSHYRNVSGTWTKQTDPATPPDGIGNRVAFSPNNQLMVVAHDSSTYLTAYQAYQWLDMDGTGASSTYGGVAPASFATAFQRTLAVSGIGVSAGASGMTIRQFIDSSDFTRTGDRVKVTFQTLAAQTLTVTRATIGKAASSGDAYDFASAPTQITFNGGNAGFTLGASSTKTSDEIVFDFDGSDIIIAFHVTNTGDEMAASNDSEASLAPYYKQGAQDTSTVNATGYTSLASTRDVAAISKIQVLAEEDGGSGLYFVGTLYNEAKRVQAVSILNDDVDVEHALRITVDQGKLLLRVGSEFGEEDLIAETTLGVGEHSLAFTPTTNLFFVQFASNTEYSSILSSCQIEASGDMTLTTPWSTADLDFINYTQSGDIVYVACKDNPRYKIERRATRSWSVVKYQPNDQHVPDHPDALGPFRRHHAGGQPRLLPRNPRRGADQDPICRTADFGQLHGAEPVQREQHPRDGCRECAFDLDHALRHLVGDCHAAAVFVGTRQLDRCRDVHQQRDQHLHGRPG